LGVLGGILLCIRYRHAVPVIKGYLVVVAVVSFLLVSLPFVFGLPPDVRTRVAGVYMFRAAATVLPTIFWFLYFKHSKRVQATYGGR
jgi:hypothetical protein